MTTKWATTLGPLPVQGKIVDDGYYPQIKLADRTIHTVTYDSLFATEEGALTYMIQSCDTLIAYQEKKRDKLLARLKEIG